MPTHITWRGDSTTCNASAASECWSPSKSNQWAWAQTWTAASTASMVTQVILFSRNHSWEQHCHRCCHCHHLGHQQHQLNNFPHLFLMIDHSQRPANLKVGYTSLVFVKYSPLLHFLTPTKRTWRLFIHGSCFILMGASSPSRPASTSSSTTWWRWRWSWLSGFIRIPMVLGVSKKLPTLL